MAIVKLDDLYPIKVFDPTLEPQPVKWMIENLWQEGKLNGVFGAEKSGKSRLLAWLLVALLGDRQESVGLRIMSKKQPKTLYLLGEETQEDVTARFVRYMKLQNVSTDEMPLSFINAAGMRLEKEEYRKWLEAKIKEYDLLIIDPLRRVHGADENDNSVMALVNNDLRRWSNSYGLTIILVHHTGKLNEFMQDQEDRIATWSRGATDLAAILDTAMLVNRYQRDKIKVIRRGRFPPQPDLKLLDHGDAVGFRQQ